jgi:ribokinase
VTRLQTGTRHPTSVEVTARDPVGRTLTVVVPGARLRMLGPDLDDLAADDVVLLPQGLPRPVTGWVASVTRDRGARLVVNGSPYAELPSDVLETADPFVVSDRDAALLADVGVLPRSLCVTFGRAGAVWDGLRVDSDDLGTPAISDGGTEAFCGALAASLAAGLDRTAALRAAVLATGRMQDD